MSYLESGFNENLIRLGYAGVLKDKQYDSVNIAEIFSQGSLPPNVIAGTDIEDALTNAATAIVNAAAAQGTADGKVITFFQSSIPTSEAIGDLWIDTDDENKLYRAEIAGANEIKAGEWVLAQDQGIGAAIAAAGTAQNTADSKIVTFAQDAIPTSTDVGDLWIDTNDNNKLYRAASIGANEIKAGEWISVRDADIANAIAAASDAQATADGKVVTFIQDAIPTSEGIGDLWIDSNDGNKLYRAASAGANEITAGEWVEIRDTGIAAAISAAGDAQDTADGKIVTFYAASVPTAEGAGDIWFDTDDNNTPYRATAAGDNEVKAGEWIKIENPVADWANIRAGTNANALAVGDSKLTIDGANKRITVNDGTNDRVLLGYLSGKF